MDGNDAAGDGEEEGGAAEISSDWPVAVVTTASIQSVWLGGR